jgi:hypothetical protein
MKITAVGTLPIDQFPNLYRGHLRVPTRISAHHV